MLSEQTNGDVLSGNGSASEDHPNGESEFDQNAGAADTSSQSAFDPSALSGLAGLFGSGGIDFNTIMGIGKVLSAAGEDDKNTALLLALKPHLNEVRQQKVDKAVKMLKIYALILALKDSGMLGQII